MSISAFTTSGLLDRSGLGGIRGLNPTAGPPPTIAFSIVWSFVAFCHAWSV